MTLLRPKQRGAAGDSLRALLLGDRFRLGRDTGRVAQNLAAHGGSADERAQLFVGNDLPPLGAPSITLGAARGTLGPHSFGFLDNQRGVAPFAAPLVARPRRGPIALVCGRRDALPDVAPLCVARGLGVSWIVSAGDGEVDDLLAFLASDDATRAVLLAAPALKPASFAALGGKPAVVLGGDPLVRAAARRAGGVAVDDLEAWLAHGSLLESGVARPEHPAALVIGGGAQLVEQALAAAGLLLTVHSVGDDDPDEILAAIERAASSSDLLLAFGSEPPPAATSASVTPSLFIDIGHLDRARALAAAIVALRRSTPAPVEALPAQRTQARAVFDEAGDQLADHDTKRVLKFYGARVSRQGPANSATAALRVGAAIGLPVDVVAPARGDAPLTESTRHARTTAELRRAAAVLLDGEVPYVLVREWFAKSPRARLSIRRDRDVGTYALVTGKSEERALLPLDRADAALLATAAAGYAEPELVELLLRIAGCATECNLTLDAELFVGESPAVIAAAAHRDRA